LSFSHWAHHFLAISSKVHEFVQNSVFSTTSERFVCFPLGAPLFSDFSKVDTGLYKTAFLLQRQNVLPFSHWVHHLIAIFSKAHEFVQNSVFSPRSASFVIFGLCALLFGDF